MERDAVTERPSPEWRRGQQAPARRALRRPAHWDIHLRRQKAPRRHPLQHPHQDDRGLGLMASISPAGDQGHTGDETTDVLLLKLLRARGFLAGASFDML